MVLKKITNFIYNLFSPNRKYSHQDLLDSVASMQVAGTLDKSSADIIMSSLQLSETRAEDVMIPTPEIVSINYDSAYKDIMQIMVASKHSRYPVVHENTGEVHGILFAKDMLEIALTAKHDTWRDFIKPAFIVPQKKRLDILLNEFRKNHNHLAIVIDEYGSTIGVVTIENVLEQIVGDIVDEHDEDEDYVQQLSDNQFSVNALLTIDEFNKYFSANFDDAKFDTIGGYVTYHMHKIPKKNDRIKLNDFDFIILNSDMRRIYTLQVSKSKNLNI